MHRAAQFATERCGECGEPLRNRDWRHSLAACNPLWGGIPCKAARQSVSFSRNYLRRATERWQLINFLERMLRELQAHETGYPKVLLLRKKEIQRKTFQAQPDASSFSIPLSRRNGSASRRRTAGVSCSRGRLEGHKGCTFLGSCCPKPLRQSFTRQLREKNQKRETEKR